MKGQKFSQDKIPAYTVIFQQFPKAIQEVIKCSQAGHKKYPDDIVSLIKSDREKGMSYKELMNKYNILSKGTLSYIINNR